MVVLENELYDYTGQWTIENEQNIETGRTLHFT
jgi:hypothetical protein